MGKTLVEVFQPLSSGSLEPWIAVNAAQQIKRNKIVCNFIVTQLHCC